MEALYYKNVLQQGKRSTARLLMKADKKWHTHKEAPIWMAQILWIARSHSTKNAAA
jgi:hypothetical protein